MSNLALFSYNNGYMRIPHEGTYMIPLDPYYLGGLIINHSYSNEVNIVNRLLKEYEGKGRTFVDIGANVGLYTINLARVFDKVYAFEPAKHTYNCMCGNIAIQDVSDKVETFNIGLYNKETDLNFFWTDIMGSNNFFETEDEQTNEALAFKKVSDKTTLHVTTLDSFNIDNIDLIKIDTEGTELQVLQGSVETLKRNNYPDIIVESWNPRERHESTGTSIESLIQLRKDLFEFIESLGYKLEHLEEDVFLAKHV